MIHNNTQGVAFNPPDLAVRRRQLMQMAVEQLQSSPYPAIRRVRCQLDDGVLTLTGVVPSYHEKQLAQNTLLHRVTDDDHLRIDNRLEVRDPG